MGVSGIELICESNRLADYLEATEVIDHNHHSIKDKADELYNAVADEGAFVQLAFEFVRDQIAHSWDIQSSRITCHASDVLRDREGICYAKSHLLSALLRSKGVSAGFCYQRLTLGDTPDSGYCIHALNAVYIASLDRWIRLDARGNKPGIDAQFSLLEEQLAFPIRAHYDEIDYPVIYAAPHAATIAALKGHTDCLQMYLHGLPTSLQTGINAV